MMQNFLINKNKKSINIWVTQRNFAHHRSIKDKMCDYLMGYNWSRLIIKLIFFCIKETENLILLN